MRVVFFSISGIKKIKNSNIWAKHVITPYQLREIIDFTNKKQQYGLSNRKRHTIFHSAIRPTNNSNTYMFISPTLKLTS